MNQKINTALSRGLRQCGFMYVSCGSLTKNKEKKKEIGDLRYIYQNELDKACFQHDTAYGDFKGQLLIKHFMLNYTRYDGYLCGLASIIHIFLIRSHLVFLLQMVVLLKLKLFQTAE